MMGYEFLYVDVKSGKAEICKSVTEIGLGKYYPLEEFIEILRASASEMTNPEVVIDAECGGGGLDLYEERDATPKEMEEALKKHERMCENEIKLGPAKAFLWYDDNA